MGETYRGRGEFLGGVICVGLCRSIGEHREGDLQREREGRSMGEHGRA
jgi:hypothetical protein